MRNRLLPSIELTPSIQEEVLEVASCTGQHSFVGREGAAPHHNGDIAHGLREPALVEFLQQVVGVVGALQFDPHAHLSSSYEVASLSARLICEQQREKMDGKHIPASEALCRKPTASLSVSKPQ